MSHPTFTSLSRARAVLLRLGLVVVALPALALTLSRTPAASPAAIAVSGTSAPVRQATRQSAFSVTWERKLASPDGQSRRLATSKRYQRSDGAHRIVHTFYSRDGSESGGNVYFGLTGLGYFRANDESRMLVFTTPMAADPQPADLEAFLRAQPEFDREEDVRDQRTIVWRRNDATGEGYTEEYRAPALGGLILKQVVSSARGVEVFEPTELTLGEPAARLFVELSGYTVDYSHFEGKIREMERDGNPEIAHRMRQAMTRMKEARHDGR
jgi:hypothetical protein